LRVLRSRADALHAHQSWIRQGGAIVLVVLGLMAIHTAQVWLYAVAYGPVTLDIQNIVGAPAKQIEVKQA